MTPERELREALQEVDDLRKENKRLILELNAADPDSEMSDLSDEELESMAG